MKVGGAQVCITPKLGSDIYHFEDKIRKGNIVDSDLYASILALESAGFPLIIISLDLIWISAIFDRDLKNKIYLALGFLPDNILICATHTHSSPQISFAIKNGARPDPRYIESLIERIVDNVQRAWNAREVARIELHTFVTNSVINRRKKIIDISAIKRLQLRWKIANRPNFHGYVDDTVSIVNFVNNKGVAIGGLFNMACHPTLNRSNTITADFPGYLQELMVNRFNPHYVVCFLQGFAGNVKAAVVKKKQFNVVHPLKSLVEMIFDSIRFKKYFSPDSIATFACRIFSEVPWNSKWRKIDPFFSVNSKVLNVDSGIVLDLGSTGVQNLESHEQSLLFFSRFNIAQDLIVFSMSGEIFAEYARWLRTKLQMYDIDLIPVGYAGGMIGYVPDLDAMLQGGYEVERSVGEFGRVKLPKCTEQRIKDVIISMFDGIL